MTSFFRAPKGTLSPLCSSLLLFSLASKKTKKSERDAKEQRGRLEVARRRERRKKRESE